MWYDLKSLIIISDVIEKANSIGNDTASIQNSWVSGFKYLKFVPLLISAIRAHNIEAANARRSPFR